MPGREFPGWLKSFIDSAHLLQPGVAPPVSPSEKEDSRRGPTAVV
jgi:hypothetical protein